MLIDCLTIFVYMALKSGCIQLRCIQTYVSTNHIENLNISNLTLGTVMNWQHLRVARTLQHWQRSNLIVWNFWWMTILVESHICKVNKLVDQPVSSLIDKTNDSILTLGTMMNRDHQTVNCNLTTKIKHIFWLLAAKSECNLVGQPFLLKILTHHNELGSPDRYVNLTTQKKV